jgi:alpha-galactosidase
MMPNDPSIVVIGAGSQSFSIATLHQILKAPELQKATLNLVDINESQLNIVNALANRIKDTYDSKIEIISVTERNKVLFDADFVILSVAVDRMATWRMDEKIAKEYGIWHYAENGGPGAFGHTARNITTILPIINDIQDDAKEAWIINFTNPLTRIHYAVNNYSKLRCISFCHQYWHGYNILGQLLRSDLEKQGYFIQNEDYSDIRDVALKEYDILAAGLNHFTWMLEIRRKSTYEDLYPLVSSFSKILPLSFERLSLDVFRVFGLFPVPGETHLSEYLPYTTSKDKWDKYNLYFFNKELAQKDRQRNSQKISEIISGKISVDNLTSDESERLATIISKIHSNANSYEPSINTENKGSIKNLPKDAVVEIPCVINRQGASGVRIGDLPEAIAALCRRQISIAKLITKGSVEGSRDHIIQAFALDPLVNDLTKAEKLVEAYIQNYIKDLPQFGRR